jgi:hypothetical protein
MTDSEDEKLTHDRALEVIKTLLRENWGIESFLSVYHEKRIKAEYRADSLDHGGEPGRGDLTWSDILAKPADERDKYLKREPHFHLFLPTKRGQFDYSVTEAVENKTGWMFHRVEKKGEDNYKSVENLDDLVRQVMYCLSHSNINNWHGKRHELTTRMKGELHNCYAPDDSEDEILASFCKYSQKLLGVRFRHHSGTCDAEMPSDSDYETADSHPLEDIYGDNSSSAPTLSGGNYNPDALDNKAGDVSESAGSSDSSESSVPVDHDSDPIPEYARGARCGGSVRPIREVVPRLDDAEWTAQAAHSEALRLAVEEWRDLDEPEVDELTPT